MFSDIPSLNENVRVAMKLICLSPGKLKNLQINSTAAAQFQVADTPDAREPRGALGKPFLAGRENSAKVKNK